MPDNVIRVATSNANPKRACGTCRHIYYRNSLHPQCRATGFSCAMERSSAGPCGSEGLLWEREPPRIGVIGWVKRLLFGEAK